MNQQPRLTERARQDLQEAWDYLAQHHLSAADRLIDAVLEKAHFLAEFPKTGRPRDDIRPGVRTAVVTPYVILFHAEDDTVEILRVLHGSRDIERIMANEE